MTGRLAAFLVAASLFAADAKLDATRWWSHVLFLADDKLEGRETGSAGHRRAAEYVAGAFERSGLKPAGVSGYFQPVRLNSRRIVERESSLTLLREGKREPLALGEQAFISMRTEAPESVRAPLVFAGYGLVVPEAHYDDLAGLDLRGRIVVYFNGSPNHIPGPLRAHYSSLAERWQALDKAGVIGTVAINNPNSYEAPWPKVTGARFQPSMSLADEAPPPGRGKLSVTFNPLDADRLLAGSGHNFREILALAAAGKPLPAFPLPVSLEAKVHAVGQMVESQNVAAVLPGSDPVLASEYVVLSAHLDHLGLGAPVHGDKVYNGAMDNASGIATLLEIAQALHQSRARLRRSLLFVAVTGEEEGLLGSQYFAAHPAVKLENIVADLNVDMFLPLFPLRRVTVLGLDESDLGRQVREVAEGMGIHVEADPEPQRNRFIRSDQYNFIRKGVPSLAIKVGYVKGSPEEATARKWLAERYHQPSDDVHQPVNGEAAVEYNRLLLRLAAAVSNRTERPSWNRDSFFRRFAGSSGSPP